MGIVHALNEGFDYITHRNREQPDSRPAYRQPPVAPRIEAF
jgi:hypothetical protein